MDIEITFRVDREERRLTVDTRTTGAGRPARTSRDHEPEERV
jgi:hypothetical protein